MSTPSPTTTRAPTTLPRVVIAAPASGHGKTTVATGLMGALRREGLTVAPAKIGPDYIDPGYHAMATGRPGRNLDAHLCDPDQLAPLLLHGAARPEPADVAVIEGVMGLFDGQLGRDGYASTAHVAALLAAPVVLVLDISSMARTAAALVHGLSTFDPGTRLAGVVLNKAGSPRHSGEVTAALEATGLPVLGVLPRNVGIEAPSRHLGLVPAGERAEAAASIDRLAALVGEHLDLAAILAVAHTAPSLPSRAWNPYAMVRPSSEARPIVAVAAGRAFTFRYAETEELLRVAGCEPVPFDPVTEPTLPPETAGLYLGGGFPEVHATELSANGALRDEIRTRVAAGLPTVAECAGLLYLCRRVDGVPMVGALEADAVMTPRLTLGYRTLVAPTDSLLGPAGTRVTGHEFHRTVVSPEQGDAAAWLVGGVPVGFSLDPAGTGRPTLHASYQHLHWAGHPRLAQSFADAVHAYADRGAKTSSDPATGGASADHGPKTRSDGGEPASAAHDGLKTRAQAEPDLHHHGDADLGDGLVDLAVNVRVTEPPPWLAAVIRDSVADLAAYPRPGAARQAIAAAHRVREDQVLPLAGGAEGFTLLARALHPARPVVVHPQFTEPEAALRAAGHHPVRLLLRAGDSFTLEPDQVPADADLVMVGNPTNPTSVLHPAAIIRALVRPGRVVVVDEAFMDAVPGEPQSLLTDDRLGPDLTGVLVLRSLTKTWGLAGLRTGYAVGDADVIARLRAQQPPWSVSTPALAATVACLTPAARAEAEAAARQVADDRAYLASRLTGLGLPPVQPARAPFLLVDTSPWRTPNVRRKLRDRGFAVRRGESFPGLGPAWLRIAVRDRGTSDRLVAALATIGAAEPQESR